MANQTNQNRINPITLRQSLDFIIAAKQFLEQEAKKSCVPHYERLAKTTSPVVAELSTRTLMSMTA